VSPSAPGRRRGPSATHVSAEHLAQNQLWVSKPGLIWYLVSFFAFFFSSFPVRSRRSHPVGTMSAQPLAILRDICNKVPRDSAGTAEWGDCWLALHYLCPDAAAGAAKILDEKSVTRVVASSSGREYFLVEGNGRTKAHTCVAGFCTCKSYCMSVASRPDLVVCKHELAVMLADALGLTLRQELDDGEWTAQYLLATTMPMMEYDAATTATASPHS
jgi:predicted nucleic acid-binding Zn finger protein